MRPRWPTALEATHTFEVSELGTRYTWTSTIHPRGPIGPIAARLLARLLDRTIVDQHRTLAAWLDQNPGAAGHRRAVIVEVTVTADPDRPNHYRTLGVGPDASLDAIHDAYRRRARTVHPDASGADDGRMAEINQAWYVLRDPERRRVYDTTLDGAAIDASSMPDDRAAVIDRSPFTPSARLHRAFFVASIVMAILVALAMVLAAMIQGH